MAHALRVTGDVTDNDRGIIAQALAELGVKGRVCVKPVTKGDTDRYVVEVNGEYYGIYDMIRRTFVD